MYRGNMKATRTESPNDFEALLSRPADIRGCLTRRALTSRPSPRATPTAHNKAGSSSSVKADHDGTPDTATTELEEAVAEAHVSCQRVFDELAKE